MKKALIFTIVVAFLSITPNQTHGISFGKKSKYKKDGVAYCVTKDHFRARWWDHFERAMSCEEGEFYERAIDDLKAALKSRDNDARMAKTYGLHFIEYFPHRELGIIYFKQGKFEDAIKELEKSISQEETAKAAYYLNKARSKMLERTSGDTQPPTVAISSPRDRLATTDLYVWVSGFAGDDAFVESLEVGGEPVIFDVSQKDIPFRVKINLKRGKNEIIAHAKDLLGKEARAKVIVILDRDGPVISVEKVEAKGSKVKIIGHITDDSQIKSFRVGSQDVKLKKVAEGLQFEVNITPPADNMVKFEAIDGLKNSTSGQIDLAGIGDSGAMYESPYMRFASLSPTPYFSVPTAMGPELKLFDVDDSQTITDPTFALKGYVSGVKKIKSISVNGEQLRIGMAREVFFNFLLKLDGGPNRFTIVAEDINGGKTQRLITINRKLPQALQLSSRMVLAVSPFEDAGTETGTVKTLYDYFIKALTLQKRFFIVERDKLDEILKEQKISALTASDPGTALELGKLNIANGVLFGTANKRKHSLEVTARLVNTETSLVMSVVDVYGEDLSPMKEQELMSRLSLKLKATVPLLEGTVVKIEGKTIYIDLGSRDRLIKDQRIIIYKEGQEIRHPVTGKLLGKDTIELGQARVEDIFEDFSKSKLIQGFDASRIKAGAKVITK